MHFWQGKNLFGQASRKLGWVITTGNPVRQGSSQRHRAEEEWADSQEWEARERLNCWALCPCSQRWALDKLVVPLMEAGSKVWDPPFLSCFACPHTLRHRHPKISQWLKASVPPNFPIDSQATPKEGINGQDGSKTWWDSPSHLQSPSPSFGNSRSKSLILCGSPLNSVPFLRGSSFTSKWQSSTSTVGQALIPRWNQEIWVGALLFHIGCDWLQWSYYWKNKHTHTCLLAKQFFSWEKLFNEVFSQWKWEKAREATQGIKDLIETWI